MADDENAKAGCAALSVAIAERIEAMHEFAVEAGGGLKAYESRARRLVAKGEEIGALAEAMLILAQTPREGRG